MRKLLFAFSILTILLYSCEEDNQEKLLTIVTGTVSDSNTNEVISGYTILIYEQDRFGGWEGTSTPLILKSAATNENGVYYYEFYAEEETDYYLESGVNINYGIFTKKYLKADATNTYDFKVDRIEN